MIPTEVQALLRDDAGDQASARVLSSQAEADDGRVAVLIDGPRTPLYALGTELELRLRPGERDALPAVRARVLQHRSTNSSSWYVLEVEESQRAVLQGVYDSRRHVRVRPAVVEPIEAVLSAADGSRALEVIVKDLSESGVGLLMHPPEDLELLCQPRLRVVLRLPDGEPALELLADVAFRRLAGSLLHYGLTFDRPGTPGFKRLRGRLAAWIVARQASSPTRRAG